MESPDIQAIRTYLLSLQDTICEALAAEDGKAVFHEDAWNRPNGGDGRTRVMSNGQVFEQAGVNFSHVYGEHMPAAATVKRPELAGCSFQAMRISLVLHPLNPYIPTVHLNVRFFVAERPGAETIWWFVVVST